MKTLKLVNDDLVIENGDFVYVDGIDEIAQGIERRITTRLTEFFLDINLGMDYEPLQTKAPDNEAIRDAIGQAITADSRIVTVESISIDLKPDRTANITFKATTTLGEIAGEVAI
jgi:hypothetical protein